MDRNDYILFAGYVVLQFIVLSTAWNILGGYCGYVNFGTAGFFAVAVDFADCTFANLNTPEALAC